MINNKSAFARGRQSAISVLKSTRFWAFIIVFGLNVFTFVRTAPYAFQDLTDIQAENLEQEKDKPQILKTNMFELEYRKLFSLQKRKFGGGLGATDHELIVLSGDGQIRVMDFSTLAVTTPALLPPVLNEAQARSAAAKLEPDKLAERALDRVKKWMRYDDILVFFDSEALYLIISYHYFDPKMSCFTHRVSGLRAPKQSALADLIATPDDWDLLFSSKPCFLFKRKDHPFAGHRSGGRLDVLDQATGDILLALGDYGFDGVNVPEYPQNRQVDYGKILKINIHSKRKEIVSVGHRNPQGIKVDDIGRIWSVEHGPQGGDELNLIKEGENYGWPNVTYGINYGSKPWPLNKNQGRHDGYHQPAFAWVPSIAVSNIDQSRNFHPFWEGDLLVFSLKEKSFYRTRLHNNSVRFVEQIEFIERIRYGLNHAPTKKLYLWTDKGNIYEIKPNEDAWMLLRKSLKNQQLKQNIKQIASRAEEVLAQCIECHSGGNAAPELYGVFGREIGGTTFPDYSSSLRDMDGVWDEEKLKAFLSDPETFATGTSMPDPQISSGKALNEIVQALKELEQ